MMVVPNRQEDLYTRLWCVYEIFVARSLGVPVTLGGSLASAGTGSSAEARCSNNADKQRIRHDIETKYGEKEGYNVIDMAIARTGFSSNLTFARVLVQAVLPTSGAVTAVVHLSKFSDDDGDDDKSKLLGIIMSTMGISLAVGSAFHTCKNAQGRPSWDAVLAVAGANVFAGMSTHLLSYLPLKFGGCSTSWAVLTIMVIGLVISLVQFLLRCAKTCSVTTSVKPTFAWSWLSHVILVLLLLCAYHASHGPTSRCGSGTLLNNLRLTPWTQFGFCLSFYSATWPFGLAVVLYARMNSTFAMICKGVLVITALIIPVGPVCVMWQRGFSFNAPWYYCCAVFFALMFTAVVLMPLSGCWFGIRHWGIRPAEPRLRPVHFGTHCVLLSAAAIQCYMVVIQDLSFPASNA